MSGTAVFDLDGTLIGMDSAETWLRFLVSRDIPGASLAVQDCEDEMSAPREKFCMKRYMQYWLKPLLGMSHDSVATMAADFARTWVAPLVFEQARGRLAWHRLRGDTLLVISASPALLVKPVAAMLGVQEHIGIELPLREGCFTEGLREPFSFREGKVSAVSSWLAGRGLSGVDYAYSDSSNDLPLLEMADRAVCINPDESLDCMARRQGWEICAWH